MKKQINIAQYTITEHSEPFIIAELSGNHNQDLDLALKMIDEAAKSGAHAIKLQTYTPDTMTLDIKEGDFYISDPDSLWFGKNLYELYGKAYTPWEWHQQLFERAKAHGMVAFSSPFDKTSVDFLETLDVPCYKIASFENTDIPLIKYVASKGKPIIMSTGMASVAEISEAIEAIKSEGCEQLILLKCTSTYPASAENTNISTIPHMSSLFNCLVGLSDHTKSIGVSVASIAMGACVVEKHFVLDRSAGGVDADFSLEPSELSSLVENCHIAKKAIGEITYGGVENEEKSKKYRRSIFINRDMKAGEKLTPDNMQVLRPSTGLAPKYYELLLGRSLTHDVKRGTPLSWDIV